MRGKYTKYPRTPHLPWSPGATDDDVYRWDVRVFEGREVVVTEKRDGENTTMYRDHVHARSIDSRHHPSRDWVKRRQGEIGHMIPDGWRVCGENLFARHSIAYTDLPSYFEVFSIWDADDRCLGWEDTVEWCALLGLIHVPVIYQGPWDEALVRDLVVDVERQEGYVVRTAGSFHLDDFAENVAKWVRANHVTTDQNWMYAQLEPNELAEE